MNKLNSLLIRNVKNQAGATMVEYALMVALIAIVSIAMITGVGKSVNNTFSTVNSALQTG